MDSIENSMLAQALQRCASEPIQYAGAIQSHGVLLAIDNQGVLQMCSDNLKQLFVRTAEQALQRPVAELISPELTAQITACIGKGTHVHLTGLKLGQPYLAVARSLSAMVHQSGQLTIAELTAEMPELTLNPELADLHSLLLQINQCNDLTEFCDYLVQELRRLNGFDRVLVYRFDSQWNGSVIAESRNTVLPALLEHHFPASDIPPQARALYAKPLLRNLVDRDVETVPLLPALNPIDHAPLDLSWSILRAVSPVHIEYLRHLGVRSTMTLPLLHDGKLWGLITCHNALPVTISTGLRVLIEAASSTLSLKIAALEYQLQLQLREEVRQQQGRLVEIIQSTEDVRNVFTRYQAEYLNLADVDGSYIVCGAEQFSVGDVPTDEELAELLAWLKTQSFVDGVFSTDMLGSLFAPAKNYPEVAAGLLCVALDDQFESLILCFRAESIRHIAWAGSPYASVVRDQHGPMIEPRRSFAAWLEVARGYSQPWAYFCADALKVLAYSIVHRLKTPSA